MTFKHTTHTCLLLVLTTSTLACWCGGEEEKTAPAASAMDRSKQLAAMRSAIDRGDFDGARARVNQIEASGGEVSADVHEMIERGLARQKEEWMAALDAELAREGEGDYEAAAALAGSLKRRGVALGEERERGLALLGEAHKEKERLRLLIVDLPALAGKSPKQVRELLGEPTACERLKVKKKVILQFDHCTYALSAPTRLQVDYILGKAAFFEVFGARGDLSSDILPRLGFEKTPPQQEAGGAMSWFTLEGFHSVVLMQPRNTLSLQIQVDHIERSRMSKDKAYRKRVIRGSRLPR